MWLASQKTASVEELQTHYLWAQIQGHHAIFRLEERGIEKGQCLMICLERMRWAIVSQTNIGTVSKTTLRKLLRDGDGLHIAMGFPKHFNILN